MEGVLAAPTINYHYYPAFMEYPGSTSLDLSTAIGLILDISRGFAQQGFHKIYFLNTGISTLRALEEAENQLKRENINIDYLNLLEFSEQPEIKKLETQKRGTHADEIETSMLLYMAPAVVRMEKAQKDDHEEKPGGLTRNPEAETGIYSPTGAWGDPTLASKEKGEIISNALLKYLIIKITQFAQLDTK
jgi:creatinine amidohydrolase